MMIERHVYWRGEISAAHRLELDYESKCNRLHGHNYMVEVWAYGDLDKNGMIIDFSVIKEIVFRYDHRDLNDILDQPTAENIAGDILRNLIEKGLGKARVRVWEDKDSYAEVEWNHEDR